MKLFYENTENLDMGKIFTQIYSFKYINNGVLFL
jgi:hypothetical protein